MTKARLLSRRRWWYPLLWVGLFALASCQSEATSPSGPAPIEIGGVQGRALAAVLADLDARDAAVIEGFEETVPPSIPEHAVAWAAFMAGQNDEPPSPSHDLIVASVRPTPLRIDVICVDAAGQVPCSDETDVWEVTFDAPQGAVLDTAGANDHAAAAVLLVVDGDEHRADLASRGFWTNAAPELTADPGDRYEHDAILGGCGFATLVDNLTPTQTFTPLTAAPRASSVYLLVQICSDATTEAIVPILGIDSTRVERVVPASPAVAVEPGAAYLFELDLNRFREANRLQAFVLPVPDREAWVSWPLQLSG